MTSSLIIAMTCSSISQARPVPDFGDSITWADSGENPSLANLEGKSVLILFFQSWCGICNGWSGNLFKDLEKHYQDDRQVVIVALKTDGGSIKDAENYLNSRADTSNWLVGVDKNASYYKSVAGNDRLYQHAWIKPDGTIGELKKSGSYTPLKNGKKLFSLSLIHI